MNMREVLNLIIVLCCVFVVYTDYDDKKRKRELLADANDIMRANIAAIDRMNKPWWRFWK